VCPFYQARAWMPFKPMREAKNKASGDRVSPNPIHWPSGGDQSPRRQGVCKAVTVPDYVIFL
jgi:hypothetical protein